jgi:hypothetical protein
MPWSKAEADALIAAASNLGTAIERQHADHALRVSEEKFELAFHHTYVAMAISSADMMPIKRIRRVDILKLFMVAMV